VFFPPLKIGGRTVDPFFNINRPEDLGEAEALLTA
jgi:molybdopterin-guanine dinucleotide biosynthesis protein A